MNVSKAIIPVAGWGTRRLPITKAIEKCMLPIGNRPVIDFVVQDCLQAGITDIYFVVSGGGKQLKDYYSTSTTLEAHLREKGKEALITAITPPKDVTFHYVTQNLEDGRYGSTIPVWLCQEFVQPDEHVLVIMGDQFFYRRDGGSNAADLIKLVENSEANAGLLGVPVPIEEVYKYGVIEKDSTGFYKRIVEHPDPKTAPSNINNASFYLFDTRLFEYL